MKAEQHGRTGGGLLTVGPPPPPPPLGAVTFSDGNDCLLDLTVAQVRCLSFETSVTLFRLTSEDGAQRGGPLLFNRFWSVWHPVECVFDVFL